MPEMVARGILIGFSCGQQLFFLIELADTGRVTFSRPVGID